MYVSPNHFATHLKLTQYSISTVLQLKKINNPPGHHPIKPIRTNLVSDISFAAVVLGLLGTAGVPGRHCCPNDFGPLGTR